MKTELLVAVWARPADQADADWEFASGYAVSENRILTVAHVLKGEGPHLIEVQFACRSESHGQLSAEVVWNGHESDSNRLDALLLSCKFPDKVRADVRFLSQPNYELLDWQSNCFAHVARERARNQLLEPEDYLPAYGKMNSSLENGLMKLNVETKLDSPKRWKGASGGPVFAGELFAGVIQEVDQRKDENGDGYFEQLLAVPAWTLLSQPKFVQALRPGDLAARVKKEEDWKGRAIKKIAAELGRITDNVAVEQFQDRFGSDIRNTDARGELALRLFDRPDLFSRLSAIRRECQRERLDGATRRLIEIEHQLFPRIFPQEWRQAQWQLLQTGKTRLMWRAAASASGAEAARAGMDARPLRFRSDQNNAPESWRGTAALELGPLVLDAPTPEATALRILERLACDELPPDLLPVTATILAKTKSDRCNVQPGDLKLTADAAPTLAKKLWAYVSEQAQMDEATPYCLIRVDDGHLTCERFEAAYVHLQRWLPELDFMELHPSAESGEYEVKLLSLLKSRVEG